MFRDGAVDMPLFFHTFSYRWAAFSDRYAIRLFDINGVTLQEAHSRLFSPLWLPDADTPPWEMPLSYDILHDAVVIYVEITTPSSHYWRHAAFRYHAWAFRVIFVIVDHGVIAVTRVSASALAATVTSERRGYECWYTMPPAMPTQKIRRAPPVTAPRRWHHECRWGYISYRADIRDVIIIDCRSGLARHVTAEK